VQDQDKRSILTNLAHYFFRRERALSGDIPSPVRECEPVKGPFRQAVILAGAKPFVVVDATEGIRVSIAWSSSIKHGVHNIALVRVQ
jgi:hypothetical protein